MTSTLHEDVVRAAAAALARAEIHDDRITADKTRTRVWAESMQIYQCDDTAIACHAVDAHYTAPDARPIKVGDVIDHYRRHRRDHAEREKGTQAAAQLGPGHNTTEELPIPTEGKPIWEAYEHWNAITITCPTCDAQPEHACTNPLNGNARKIPCLARLATARKDTR